MRDYLLAIVKSNAADTSMKTLAVRVLLRLGYAFGTAQDLLLAAELQSEHKLDISWDLMPLLDKSEKFRKYAPPGNSGSN